METKQRPDGRAGHEIRHITISYDTLGYADASVFFELGQTKVLVSVTLQQGVPPFLKGQRVGWLSAEYAMLPSATHQRTMRESLQGKQNPRNVEISRLIGRCLRATIDLTPLGERTIVIDCDVLQADGGTRVASITAASLALEIAIGRWIARGIIAKSILKTRIAAISVGLVKGIACADLSYIEDSSAEADFNFVVSAQGELIEVQGTSEKAPIPWAMFESLRILAIKGIDDLFSQCNAPTNEQPALIEDHHKKNDVQKARNQAPQVQHRNNNEQKSGLFSLANRFNKPE
ncbi:ribonuclease PH [Candidatus Dependentiae bacterium]|jgi:ribonuclease PH|nr:ribonuclease PH [Candidatus Dependentiae bacterium]